VLRIGRRCRRASRCRGRGAQKREQGCGSRVHANPIKSGCCSCRTLKIPAVPSAMNTRAPGPCPIQRNRTCRVWKRLCAALGAWTLLLRIQGHLRRRIRIVSPERWRGSVRDGNGRGGTIRLPALTRPPGCQERDHSTNKRIAPRAQKTSAPNRSIVALRRSWAERGVTSHVRVPTQLVTTYRTNRGQGQANIAPHSRCGASAEIRRRPIGHVASAQRGRAAPDRGLVQEDSRGGAPTRHDSERPRPPDRRHKHCLGAQLIRDSANYRPSSQSSRIARYRDGWPQCAARSKGTQPRLTNPNRRPSARTRYHEIAGALGIDHVVDQDLPRLIV